METTILTERINKAKKFFYRVKRKKAFKTVIALVVLMIVALLIVFKFGLFSKLSKDQASFGATLTTYTVSRRTITQSLTSSGTLQPNDSYTITPLVSGEILADYFDEGDVVQEDQLLYRIDSANIESSIKRVENSLKDAQKSLNNAIKDREKLNVMSEFYGVIEELYVDIGDEINAGTKIAHVVDKQTMCIDIPFLAVEAATFSKGQSAIITFPSYETTVGTVTKIGNKTSVNDLGVLTRIVTIKVKNSGGITPTTTAYASVGNANCTAPSTFYYNDEGQITAEISGEVTAINFDEGDTVNKNSVVVVLSSEDLQDRIEQLERNLEDAQSNLDDTLDNYDNYNITSPICGTVISKDYKAGDTLGGGGGNSGGTSMAVIYDMSAFKFTMNIDELDIDKIKPDQEVIVTSDARSGKEYKGKVTNVSIQGSTSNGTTVYPVTVTIENVEDETRRVTDKDGTIHKYYKTGKTGTVKKYELESAEDNIYTYSNGIVIVREVLEDGSVKFSRDNKELHLSKNSSYTLGSDSYVLSEDMQTLTVEITDETAMLRPGMNIDAEIYVQNVQNVIAVPVSAIMRGYTVKVVSRASDAEVAEDGDKSEAADSTEGNYTENMPKFDRENMPAFDKEKMPEFDMENMPTFDKENMPDFTEYNKSGASGKPEQGTNSGRNNSRNSISADTEYEEVKVSVGVTDNNYIEITDGLNVGDVVILDEVNSMLSSAGTGNTMQGFGGMGGMGMSSMGGGGFGGGAPMMGGSGSGMMRPGSR